VVSSSNGGIRRSMVEAVVVEAVDQACGRELDVIDGAGLPGSYISAVVA